MVENVAPKVDKKKPKVDKGKTAPKPMVDPDDCLEIGENALASFTRSEIQDFVDEVREKAKTYTDLQGQPAIHKALEEMNDEKLNELFGECKTKANNVAKFEMRANKIRSGWRNNIRTLLTARGRSQSDNLFQSQKAAKAALAEKVFRNLNHEQQKYLQDKNNIADMANALDGNHASQMAQSIAKVIKEIYIPFKEGELVRTDALSVFHLSDYRYLDHNHDVTKILMGGDSLLRRAKNLSLGVKGTESNPKESWIAFVKDKLDAIGNLEVNELNDEKVNKTLSNVYDNITQNKSQPFTSSTVANDREAKRRQKIMKLKFKDWKSWSVYNEKYGRGDFFSALMADIHGSGNMVGTADFFGDSPASMYMDLTKVQQDVGIKAKWPNFWIRNNDLIMKQLMGVDQNAVSPDLARLRANIAGLTSATRLVALPLRSLPDFAHGVAYLGRFGHSQFSSFGYMLANIFDNKLGSMLFPERKKIAEMFKLMTDSHNGYMARVIDSNSMGDLVTRVSTGLLKPIEIFDKGNQISVLHLMAKTLGEHSRYGWEALPDTLRSQLEYFNFSKDEWNLLRSKSEKGLFTLDNLEKVTDSELRELKTEVPLANLRSDLYRKVYSLFDVASQNMIMTPDAWGRAWLHQGHAPGTVMGEIIRAVTQFKMYPVTYFDRVWNQGLKQAEGTMPKLWYATRLLAMSMVLSYVSEWMNNYAQGKTMVDPQRMTMGDRIKYYTSLALPGTGIFLSVLDAKNQNKDLWWSVLRSPSTDLVGNALATIIAGMTGNLKQAKKDLKGVAKNITPIDTIPGISPYLREALGEQPFLQPGQQQIYGA